MLKQAFPDIPGYSHVPGIILMVRALKTLPPSLSLGFLPSPDNHRDEGRNFIYSNSTSEHHPAKDRHTAWFLSIRLI